MDRCIVYMRPDGGTSVVHPFESARMKGESDDEFLLRIAIKDVPAGVDWHIQPKASLPSRRWRNAWKKSGNAVAVDNAEARKLLNEEFQAELTKRTKDASDAVAEAEDEDGQQKAKAAKDYRKALRAMTAKVSADTAAMTTEQLTLYVVPWPVRPN